MSKSRMPVQRWTSGRGTLWIIAFMFGASAIVRFGAGTGQAIAREVAAFRTDPEEFQALQTCETPAGITELLADLTGRVEYLDSRERRLDELRQTLAVSQKLVEKNLLALVAAEEKLAATMATTQTAAESDLDRLTSVYENMNPKKAAVLFQEMAPDFAAGFVGRMRPDAAALIMAGLTPQAAYTISVILAGRNALAPTE